MRLSRRVAGELMALLDAVAIFIGGAIAYAVYPFFAGHEANHFSIYLGLMAVAAVIALPVLQASRLYTFNTVLSPRLRDVWQMFISWTLITGAVIAFAFLVQATDLVSRAWIVLWYLFAGSFILIGRTFGAMLFTYASRKGFFNRRTLVYGSDQLIPDVLQALKADASYMDVVAVFEDDGEDSTSTPSSREELMTFARRNHIENIVLALPTSLFDKRNILLQNLRHLPVNIYLGPDALSVNLVEPRRVSLGSLMFAELARKPLQDWDYVIKAAEDRILAALILFAIWPLMLAITIAVKLDSRGPVLFRQERFGFNNKLVKVYKFRTMRFDKTDPSGQTQTVPDDPRVTRVGRFLRTWSLDELPQFINVLQGRMSIVGPRAHVPSMLAGDQLYYEVVDEYASRHRVKPGITGLSQINGYRGETDTLDKARKRVEYDISYIDNWSLLLDLKIIFLTPFAVIKQTNAY